MLKGFQNSPELNFSIPEHKEAMLMAFKEVDQEKGQDYPLIIGGERIMTDKKIVSNAPSTKEVLGRVSSCDQYWQTKPSGPLTTLSRHGVKLLSRNESAVYAGW